MPFPKPAFRRQIRMLTEPYAVERRDDTTSGTYGNAPTYSTLGEERDLAVIGFEETNQPTAAGERQSILLVAYAEPSVDLQEEDRITHNGETFEVIVKEGRPHESDPAIYRYELDNV